MSQTKTIIVLGGVKDFNLEKILQQIFNSNAKVVRCCDEVENLTLTKYPQVIICSSCSRKCGWPQVMEKASRFSDKPPIFICGTITKGRMGQMGFNLRSTDVLSNPFSGEELVRIIGVITESAD